MDATANKSSQSRSIGNVSFQSDPDPVGDVIFLPTDDAGTPGLLNSSILKKLGLETSLIPGRNELREGYALLSAGRRRICFVVTVGNGSPATLLNRHLKAALSDKQLSNAKVLWIPLMGTGAGALSLLRSQKIITEALKATGWLSRSDTRITIAFPPGATVDLATRDLGVAQPGAKGVLGRINRVQKVDLLPLSAEKQSDDREDSGADDTNVLEAEDSAPLQLSSAVRGALEFAAALRNGRRQHGGSISTTLLLFALAESQAEAAPGDLAGDRAASLFSGAVHALAGEPRFREAWSLYFSPDYVLPAALPPPRPARQTANVQAVFRQAASLGKSGAAIEIDNLIVSLLNYPQGRHRLSLETMGISMDDLLREYREALTGQIGKALLNDVATETDRLGYESYAAAIKDFLTDTATPPPLSISIQAPWGAGKSSLMHQIRNKLDPREKNKPDPEVQKVNTGFKESAKRLGHLRLGDVLAFLDRNRTREISKSVDPDRLWTVWFNAWKYDTSEQIWAGLVDAIVSQISSRLNPIDRELFLLRLQLARIDDGIVRRKIYDRVVTIWWAKVRAWSLAGAAAIASLFGIHKAATATVHDAMLSGLIAWSPVAPTVILAIYLIKTYVDSRKKTHDEPASFSLAEYLNVPNYNQALGSIHHIHEDLLRVLSLTPLRPQGTKMVPSPVVIFIDDLDRCSPSKVASVVEGVSMFLASDDYGCMFVIGIDPQMIAAALEEAHAKVREQLPRYERTVPLGWRFMDKFIQLPFTIPPSSKDALEGYVDWLSGKKPIETRTESPPDHDQPSVEDEPAPPPDPSSDSPGGGTPIARVRGQLPDEEKSDTAEAVKIFQESRDVGIIIQKAAQGTSGNPREIKRLANLARLYLGLRNARRLRDEAWRSPNLDQYARWITVTLRWPDMMRWLQWGADEATWVAEKASLALSERRLQFLQDQARVAKTAEAWRKALGKELKVPVSKESDWACDHKLYEFFQMEAKLPSHERLSDAAARGFW